MAIATLVVLLLQGTGPANRMMTVEETLAFAQRVYCGNLDNEEWRAVLEEQKRANPAARERLYSMLADPARSAEWFKLVPAFAYLGQREDVARLERALRARRGASAQVERDALRALFNAYGGMGGRGIEEARAQLKAMMKTGYWKDSTDQGAAPLSLGAPSVDSLMRLFALYGYVYTSSDDFEQVARELVDATTDARDREFLRERARGAVQNAIEYKRLYGAPRRP